ncbi:MAG: permease [Alcanivoracaceae bacterium]|jgi:hypothetical protein|nr:permease [Alcanivoracaceae bacterium]
MSDDCCKPKAPACHEPEPENTGHGACCDHDNGSGGFRMDWLMTVSGVLVALGYGLYLADPAMPQWLHHYASGSFELMNAMWWGLALGIFFVGLLSRVPRETVMKLMGPGGSWGGLVRATGAGVLLDLCSHGILAVGAKLYERGASAGQVMAFLIASPWNSFSLTLILFGLIGVNWTLLFIGLSLLVALITGRVFDALVARGTLPANPASAQVNTDGAPSVVQLLREARPSVNGTGSLLWDGVKGARMVIRWALFGVVLASLIRAFVPADIFQDWFGPTLLGLGATVIAATIIEVCSEGSVPIAADLFNRAGAPGNAFTFLMAGVATDYTEVMVIRDTTRSWKLALFLPLISLPQVLLLGWIINLAGT